MNRRPTRAGVGAWLYRSSRWAIGGLFAYSGAAKLVAFGRFEKAVGDFGLLPEPAVPLAALLIAVFELLAGTGLILDLSWSLATISGLLVLFTFVVVYGISLGLDIDCGCLGPGAEGWVPGGLYGALARNVVLLALCAYLQWWRSRSGLRPMPFRTVQKNLNR